MILLEKEAKRVLIQTDFTKALAAWLLRSLQMSVI